MELSDNSFDGWNIEDGELIADVYQMKDIFPYNQDNLVFEQIDTLEIEEGVTNVYKDINYIIVECLMDDEKVLKIYSRDFEFFHNVIVNQNFEFQGLCNTWGNGGYHYDMTDQDGVHYYLPCEYPVDSEMVGISRHFNYSSQIYINGSYSDEYWYLTNPASYDVIYENTSNNFFLTSNNGGIIKPINNEKQEVRHTWTYLNRTGFMNMILFCSEQNNVEFAVNEKGELVYNEEVKKIKSIGHSGGGIKSNSMGNLFFIEKGTWDMVVLDSSFKEIYRIDIPQQYLVTLKTDVLNSGWDWSVCGNGFGMNVDNSLVYYSIEKMKFYTVETNVSTRIRFGNNRILLGNSAYVFDPDSLEFRADYSHSKGYESKYSIYSNYVLDGIAYYSDDVSIMYEASEELLANEKFKPASEGVALKYENREYEIYQTKQYGDRDLIQICDLGYLGIVEEDRFIPVIEVGVRDFDVNEYGLSLIHI